MDLCRSPTPKPEDQPMHLPSVTACLLLSSMSEGLQIPPPLSQKPFIEFIFCYNVYLSSPSYLEAVSSILDPATLPAVIRTDPLTSEHQDQYRQKIAVQTIGRAAPNKLLGPVPFSSTASRFFSRELSVASFVRCLGLRILLRWRKRAWFPSQKLMPLL
jgi:hypothetical protein